MLHLTQGSKILLAIDAVDFRKGLDGFIAICKQQLGIEKTRDGTLFVFINRSRTMIRVISYERNGYWFATKRLSRGRYRGWPTATEQCCHPFIASELRHLLNQSLAFSRQK